MRWPRAERVRPWALVGARAGVLGLLIVGLSQTRARAAERFVLESECLAAPDALARIQQLLPEGVPAESALEGVAVRVRKDGEEHVAAILLPQRRDQLEVLRTLRGESCESVIDAAIIVVGLWVSGTQPPPPPPAPPPPEAAGPPIRFGAAASVSIANVTLPGLAIAFEASSLLRWDDLRLTLGARLWPPQSARLRGGPQQGLEASMIDGVLRMSALSIVLGPLALGPSYAMAFGRLHASALNVSASNERTLLWVRSELEVLARLELPGVPVAFTALLGVGVPWWRPALRIEGEGRVFRPAQFAPYGGLGIEID